LWLPTTIRILTITSQWWLITWSPLSVCRYPRRHRLTTVPQSRYGRRLRWRHLHHWPRARCQRGSRSKQRSRLHLPWCHHPPQQRRRSQSGSSVCNLCEPAGIRPRKPSLRHRLRSRLGHLHRRRLQPQDASRLLRKSHLRRHHRLPPRRRRVPSFGIHSLICLTTGQRRLRPRRRRHRHHLLL
jgi:hypothetical protein